MKTYKEILEATQLDEDVARQIKDYYYNIVDGIGNIDDLIEILQPAAEHGFNFKRVNFTKDEIKSELKALKAIRSAARELKHIGKKL